MDYLKYPLYFYVRTLRIFPFLFCCSDSNRFFFYISYIIWKVQCHGICHCAATRVVIFLQNWLTLNGRNLRRLQIWIVCVCVLCFLTFILNVFCNEIYLKFVILDTSHFYISVICDRCTFSLLWWSDSPDSFYGTSTIQFWEKCSSFHIVSK